MSSSIVRAEGTDSDQARALEFEREIANNAPSDSNTVSGPTASTSTSASASTSAKPLISSSSNIKSDPNRRKTARDSTSQFRDDRKPGPSGSSIHQISATTSTSKAQSSTRPSASLDPATSSQPTRSIGRRSRDGREAEQLAMSSKGKAPDVDGDGGVGLNQTSSQSSQQGKQKELEPAKDALELNEAGDDSENPKQSLPNPRLDIMRLGLERFMTVIDAKVTSSAIASSLPSLNPQLLEIARTQFIGELKASILSELAKLEEDLSLPDKLRELQLLVEDTERRSEERAKRRKLSDGKDKGENAEEENEDKEWDIWRKDLDIKTAVNARIIPDQKERIRQMEKELQSLQAETATLHQSLIETNETISDRKADANQALELLKETVDALQPPPSLPDMKEQIREALQGLMEEIGPRR